MGVDVISARLRRLMPVGQLANNTVWNFIATLSIRGLRLIAVMIVARIFDQRDYGEFGIVLSSVSMFAVLAAFGMGVTAARYVGGYKQLDKELVGRVITMCFGSSLVFGGLFTLLLYLFAPWVASSLLAAPHLSAALRIGAFLLMLDAVVNVQIGILSGFQSFRSLALSNIFVGILLLVFLVAGARFGGIEGALWGMVLATFVEVLLKMVLVLRRMAIFNIAPKFRLTERETNIFKNHSLPALAAGLLSAPVLWAGNAALVNQPDGYLDMAVINIAFQWFSILLFLPGVITNAVLPIFAEKADAGDTAQLKTTLTSSAKAIGFAVIPLLAFVGLASPLIMRGYGSNYSGYWPILIIISFAALMASSQNLLGNLLAVNNQMWMHFKSNCIWALAYLGAVVFLFSYNMLDAINMAIALSGAYFIKSGYVLYVISQQFKG